MRHTLITASAVVVAAVTPAACSGSSRSWSWSPGPGGKFPRSTSRYEYSEQFENEQVVLLSTASGQF